MGRIRTGTVKKAGNLIFERFGPEFKADFGFNKQKVAEIAQIQSKKIRNKVAGYLASLVKRGPNVGRRPQKPPADKVKKMGRGRPMRKERR